jgi:hypothetical protein
MHFPLGFPSDKVEYSRNQDSEEMQSALRCFNVKGARPYYREDCAALAAREREWKQRREAQEIIGVMHTFQVLGT